MYWFAYALVMNHYMYKNREIFLNFPLLYLPNLTYKEIQRSREIQTIDVLGQHSLNHVLVVMIKDFFLQHQSSNKGMLHKRADCKVEEVRPLQFLFFLGTPH